MGGEYKVKQVTYHHPDATRGQSDDRLMKNLADDEHAPVSLSDINRSFEDLEPMPFGNWPRANKI